jgi:4-amino-4-deoxy-L-arabinose transferase-like glycosyltransferase
MAKNKKFFNLLIYFLLLHLIVWTLVPTFTNTNLPLDTIEALAWGSNLDWGFNKHPPLSAFAVEVFFQVFQNSDWAFYLLSQIFVVSAFFVVWKFSQSFFKDEKISLISVMLLEGIFFYNFTTPEFNVNVCMLPFWALTVLYCWKSLNDNSLKNWFLFGLFSGLGFISKYLFVYLIVAVKTYFIIKIIREKKFYFRYLIPGIVFLAVIFPHLIWLESNNYITLTYALNRTGLNEADIINHIKFPLTFLVKQSLILIPLFIMLAFLIKKFRFTFNPKDKKLLFLLSVNIIPIILIFFTSLVTGAKIRTMWMTPFYLFSGVFFLYLLQNSINIKKIKKFFLVFAFFFFLSPLIYLYISISKNDKRTDFPGAEIAYLVQKKWDNNFSNEIGVVVGDEWFAGNLSYHLRSRPKWYNSLENKINFIEKESGIIYVGNPKILKTVCPGIYGTIKPIGICMIGKK